jgi:ubiquinone/menaquinone biosynthesis C-methylase UbiE
MRQLPSPCTRVLDVGCGAGAFAAELAKRAEQVDALDRSAEMIDAARQMTPANVRCISGDVMRDPLRAERYDAIVSVTALHHMPLDDALRRLSRVLRPGGVLAAVALPRPDLARELPAELLAAIGRRVLGAAFAVLMAPDRDGWYRLERSRTAAHLLVLPPALEAPRRGAQRRRPAAVNDRLTQWPGRTVRLR